MNDQAKAPSILRESPVVVFVNSVARRRPGTFLSGRIQKYSNRSMFMRNLL